MKEKCFFCEYDYGPLMDKPEQCCTCKDNNNFRLCTVYESRPLSACSDPGSTKKYEAIIDSFHKKQEELKRHMDQERICADALKRLRVMTPDEL